MPHGPGFIGAKKTAYAVMDGKKVDMRFLGTRAREHAEEVIQFWLDTMRDPKAKPSARMKASENLAAYGYGRPRQTIALKAEDKDDDAQAHRELREAVASASSAAVKGLQHQPMKPVHPIIQQTKISPPIVDVESAITIPGAMTDKEKAAATIVGAALVSAVSDSGTLESSDVVVVRHVEGEDADTF